MSYCRWSSMNWQCDVYCYEDVSGGWTTHVAGNRRPFGPIPDILGSRFSQALHAWSGARWESTTREIVYESRWRQAVESVWLRFVAFWHDRIHMGSLHLIPSRAIGLPFDGESFSDQTAEECASRLEWLRSLGYKVPQYAIDALRNEGKDESE